MEYQTSHSDKRELTMHNNLELREKFTEKIDNLYELRNKTLEQEVNLFAESKFGSTSYNVIRLLHVKGEYLIYNHCDKIEFAFDKEVIFSLELQCKNFCYSYLIKRFY